jgi:hypothetical protein
MCWLKNVADHASQLSPLNRTPAQVWWKSASRGYRDPDAV